MNNSRHIILNQSNKCDGFTKQICDNIQLNLIICYNLFLNLHHVKDKGINEENSSIKCKKT